MNTNKHHIDELFVHALGNIEVVPPGSAWQAIEQKLDNKKKVRMLYIKMGFAAGIAILATLSELYFYQTSQSPAPVVASNSSSNKQIAEEKPIQHSFAQAIPVVPQNDPVKNNIIAINHTDASNAITEETVHSAVGYQEKHDIITESIVSGLQNTENKILRNNSTEQLAYLTPRKGTLPLVRNKTEIVFTPYIYYHPAIADAELKSPIADNDIRPKINRWSIEGQVAPIYSYRNITSTASGSPGKSEFNSNETGLVSYSNVLKVNYKTSSRLSIQTGLGYSVIGQTITNIYIQQPTDNLREQSTSDYKSNSLINSSLGQINTGVTNSNNGAFYANNSSQTTYFNSLGAMDMTTYPLISSGNTITTLSNVDVVHRLKVLEIPIMARYNIIARKFSMYLLARRSVNILLDNETV
jgi:hypothetical protein